MQFNKIQNLEYQVSDKINNFRQQVDNKLTNVNESQDNLRKEINQYFNLDEQNFSAINLKDYQNQESEMFDIKNLNSELGQSLMRNKNVISSKKEDQFTSDYGFMESKGPLEKQPYIPQTTTNNNKKLNPIKEESFQSTVSKQNKNLMKLNSSQLKESQLDITVNDQSVLEYIVDESGYLIDQNGFPIIDDNGKAIKLNDENIEYLKKNQLYEEVYEN